MEHRLIAKNALLNILNTLLAFAVSIATTILVARYLLPDALGILNLVQWTRVTVAAILSTSLATTITRFTAEYEGARQPARSIQLLKRVLILQLGLVVPASLALMLLAPSIASILGQPDVAGYLPIAAAALLLNALNAILSARLAGLQRFDQVALLGVATSLVSGAGAILVVTQAYGIEGLLWTEVCLGSVQGLVAAAFIVRSRPRSHHTHNSLGDKKRHANTGHIARFALGLFVMQSSDMVVWQRSETFFLGRYGRADQVAYYTLAYTVASAAVSMLAMAVSAVLLPALSQRFGTKDRGSMQIMYAAGTVWLALVTLPICALVFALAGIGVDLLYGGAYSPAADVLRILILGAGVGALATPGSSLFLSLGKMSVAVWAAAPLALLNIALARVLIPPFGATGAALASTISQFVSVVVVLIFLVWRRGFRLPLGQLSRIVAAVLPSAGGAYLVGMQIAGWSGLILGAAVGGVIYLVLLFSLSGVTSTEIAFLESFSTLCPAPVHRPLKAACMIARSRLAKGATSAY